MAKESKPPDEKRIKAFEQAVTDALNVKKPPGGWPKPPKLPKQPRKPSK